MARHQYYRAEAHVRAKFDHTYPLVASIHAFQMVSRVESAQISLHEEGANCATNAASCCAFRILDIFPDIWPAPDFTDHATESSWSISGPIGISSRMGKLSAYKRRVLYAIL